MMLTRLVTVLIVVAALAPQAPAGFFSRKPKVNPTDRVPELLTQLRGATDEAQRSAAAEELREFDGKNYPEIVVALIDALGRDSSPAVRADAATSLGKLRPISQQAGYALEQAFNNDASTRVRFAARQALWSYHLVGYRSSKPNDPSSGEPATGKQSSARENARLTGRESPEPPLAAPLVAAPAVERPRTAPPVPSNPMKIEPEPRPQPAHLQAPRTPAGVADGPALPPG